MTIMRGFASVLLAILCLWTISIMASSPAREAEVIQTFIGEVTTAIPDGYVFVAFPPDDNGQAVSKLYRKADLEAGAVPCA